MIVDCIGDPHGYYPKLDGGDLLIVAGDLTRNDYEYQYLEFRDWIIKQPYRRKIVIAGNHDMTLEDNKFFFEENRIDEYEDFDYLLDSGTEFEGLKIWGTPHSLCFDGVNPKCTAFMGTEVLLQEKYDLIPNDIDILISHTPPYGILDKNIFGEWCGSESLRNAMYRTKCKYLICGHIHECGGKEVNLTMTHVINCSILNERYQPVNKPIRTKI